MATSTKQRAVIAELVAGRNVQDAAHAVGVNPSTVWRWLRDDDFTAELGNASGDVLRAASARLAGMLDHALDRLAELIDAKNRPGAGVNLRAVDLALSHAVKLADLVDLQRRVEALETRLAEQGIGKGG